MVKPNLLLLKSFILILIVLSANFYPAFAQKENHNWHFSDNTSFNFNAGYPALTTGSQITSGEGCAAISDSLGKLLFYTNGQIVWAKDHSVMPNGTGLFGSTDVQQTVVIVPQPDTVSQHIYYIFTIGPTVNPNRLDLSYSIVDMTANGSLGDVVKKNVLLDTDVTEKLTATRNYDHLNFWVISKNYTSNQFKVYPVTIGGNIGTPVVSTVGQKGGNDDHTGAVKVSNNGCWIACTIRGVNGNPAYVEIFSFDNNYGEVSSGIATTIIEHPYGIEFSPDNTKLYIGENAFKPIHQFNLVSGNEDEIINSILDVSDSISATYTFQSAPDNKIYFATSDSFSLGCIQKPGNYYTACNIDSSLVKGLKISTGSLPNNYNLAYRGSLACSQTLDPCAIDLEKLMPKAFTPNGDGYNDCYGIKYKVDLPFVDFAIYNRWGERVFYTKDEKDCWDGMYKGKKADPANYVYYLRLRVECGFSIKKGYVVLIR